jgi:hypothetical protein
MLGVSHADVGGGLSLYLCSRAHFRSMELLHPDRRHDMISTPRLPRRRVIALGLGLGLGATALSGVLPLPFPLLYRQHRSRACRLAPVATPLPNCSVH